MVETMQLPSFYVFDEGLTVLYDQLVEVIRITLDKASSETRHKFVSETIAQSASHKHAQDSHRRGYTISQLVRGYGSLCQGITEFALENSESITSTEFAQLNLSLDVAIAQAVTEFQTLSLGSVAKEERLKMGYLVHELRNCLSSAVLSHELIRMGQVGTSGATSRIITNSLAQMRELIDRSVAEARMGLNPEIELSVFKLIDLLSEVESSLTAESNAKHLIVYTDANAEIEVEADRHLMVSAITNLVQNAFRFTKIGGSVRLRAFVDGKDAVIEVEDQCGGMAEGKIEEILKPREDEETKFGFGLSIVRRAAKLNDCILAVRNIPGTGCVFSVRMPAHIEELQVKTKADDISIS